MIAKGITVSHSRTRYQDCPGKTRIHGLERIEREKERKNVVSLR